MKYLITLLLSAGLFVGCVSSTQQPTNSIQPEVSLVTSVVLAETNKDDRTKLAQEVYNAADLAEKLINQGATLAEVKTYALQAVNNDQKKAIVSAVLDYVDSKYKVTVGLTDIQKKEIVLSAIQGVKSATSPYLGR